MQKKQILSYALLAFPLAFISLPIYIYLPQFYTKNFAINLQEIAAVLLFCRIFDAILDPVFGILSDRYKSYQRLIIAVSSLLLGVSFILLFNPKLDFNLSLWLALTLFFAYAFFSLLQINYQSYAVFLSKDEKEKSLIITTRETIGVIGIIFASILPSFFINSDDAKNLFSILSFGYFFVIIFLAAIFYFYCPNPLNQRQGRVNFAFLKNQQIRKFLLAFVFNSFALAIPAVLILFFIENVLKAPNLTGIFMMIYFVFLMFGIWLWAKIAQLMKNKVQAWCLSMFLVIIIFFFGYFLKAGDVIEYGVICALSGICFGADYCLSYMILTDLIQSSDDQQKDQNSESTIFGLVNFIIKITLALSSAVLLYFLGEIRLKNPDLEKSFLSFSYIILPCIFKAISLFLLKKGSDPFLQKGV